MGPWKSTFEYGTPAELTRLQYGGGRRTILFIYQTVGGPVYLNLLMENVGPGIEEMFGHEEIYFQQDGGSSSPLS